MSTGLIIAVGAVVLVAIAVVVATVVRQRRHGDAVDRQWDDINTHLNGRRETRPPHVPPVQRRPEPARGAAPLPPRRVSAAATPPRRRPATPYPFDDSATNALPVVAPNLFESPSHHGGGGHGGGHHGGHDSGGYSGGHSGGGHSGGHDSGGYSGGGDSGGGGGGGGGDC